MSYSRNFGFRSFENIVRHGRLKTPATGDPLVLGTAVTVDSSAPDLMKKPASAATAPNAVSGVLVYEHIQFQGVDTNLVTNHDAPFNTAPKGRYAQMVRGPGVKVWFKNTVDKVLYDGRDQLGATLVAGVGGATPTVNVGDMLTNASDGTWQKTTDATKAWMVVEHVNHATSLVEARLTF